MNLLIDSGNTSTKLVLYDHTQPEIIFKPINHIEDINFPIKNVIASVVSDISLTTLLKNLVYDKCTTVEVNVNTFGISCGYPNYKNLGIDRWCAILGAELLYPNQNIIIVDAGTAITVDFLQYNKIHLGGWISPGLELMKNSIVEKAPLVFSDELETEESIGTDTPSALSNGCLCAQYGLIQQAITEFQAHCRTKKIKVVLTGGGAPLLTKKLNIEFALEKDLIFHGLARFVE